MSGVTTKYEKIESYGGHIVDIAEEGLDHVQKVLAGIEGGWQRAVGSALSRAAATGKTAIKSTIVKRYTISQSEFLSQTRNINHFTRTSDGGVEVVFGYAGYVIPLLKFDTSVGSDGRVVTRVKRSSAKEVLEHAFKAQMGPHTGIYERIGPDRSPVKEFFGPATPQMMSFEGDDEVWEEVEGKMVETYEKRIDHEIMRLLNGWGG